jgi:hypothetical protein
MVSAPTSFSTSRTLGRPLLSRRMCAEQPPLLLPAGRQWPLQPFKHQPRIRASRENPVHDVGCQQPQPQDPADVALRMFSASPISLTDV